MSQSSFLGETHFENVRFFTLIIRKEMKNDMLKF